MGKISGLNNKELNQLDLINLQKKVEELEKKLGEWIRYYNNHLDREHEKMKFTKTSKGVGK